MTNLPVLEELLVSGGDERIALDATTQRNIYGYGVMPDDDELPFGSSTASTISSAAYAMLGTLHGRIAAGVSRRTESLVYEEEVARLREDMQAMLGYGPGRGPDIVFAPSGTDAHLVAALLLNRRDGRPIQTITLSGSETGSSVGAAAAGRHFMAMRPSGVASSRGAELSAGEDIVNMTLAVRDDFGRIRCDVDVESDLDEMIADAAGKGRRSLLFVADVSKSGLIAPGLDCVFRLRARHGDDLDVVVDACQLRMSPSTLRAYLSRGLAVAVTGSKFLGGLVFSGALLLPGALAADLRSRSLPVGVSDYCSSADWPEGFQTRSVLPERANFGLLLRWRAALFEWQALLAQPPDRVAAVVQTFGAAVSMRLREDPAFAPTRSRVLDRGALGLDCDRRSAFDLLPTIFPFHLTRRTGETASREWLDAAETAAVHALLGRGGARDRCVRLGQAVPLGKRKGVPVAALRLCLNARLIARAAADEAALAALVSDAQTALDAAAGAAAMLGGGRRRAAA